jgi:hypothetical protein
MAIDLHCYSIKSILEAKEIVEFLKHEHKGLFFERFLIYPVGEADSIQKEIALEYGIVAHSEFMVSLNDKSAADLIPTVLTLIRGALGSTNVIIFSDGEVLR